MAQDIQFIPCSTFGGGWLVPRTDAGLDACREVMGEDPAFMAPIDQDGYILEPQDARDSVQALRDLGCEVTL